jgi:rhodanese-related sulfurtransferase
MEHSKDYSKKVPGEPQPVLIDVRSLPEYAAGHPEDAYNVPYPRIGFRGDGTPPQSAAHFYDEVYRIVRGRVDTPIMTLCRTGHRSVLAANILSSGDYGPAFTNVRNIWEGFVGQPKYAFKTGTNQIELDADNDGIIDGPYLLDLNNDGVVDPSADTADVYQEIKDANPDKDGWRNFAALPWSTHIQKPLAYERDPGYYEALSLTPVVPTN